jgi:hypothetical protein
MRCHQLDDGEIQEEEKGSKVANGRETLSFTLYSEVAMTFNDVGTWGVAPPLGLVSLRTV